MEIVGITIGITILGVVFLFMFRNQISDLILRIKSINSSGVTVGGSQKESLAEKDPREEAELLIQKLDSELVRETERLIKDDLANKKLGGSEAIPVLIKYFAVVYIEYLFLNLYRIIYGSQINLLDHLNTQNGQSREALQIFYNLGASQYPDIYKNYSYDQWLGFLKDQVLLREDQGMFRVTVRGREFLLYLARSGLSRNKAG